jgi:hypothetical protein
MKKFLSHLTFSFLESLCRYKSLGIPEQNPWKTEIGFPKNVSQEKHKNSSYKFTKLAKMVLKM